ncbi:hypothetical protein [Aestuariibacter sp. A3R04]|nr:hypothetical protein [Aestuariibacter sp. A3R04]MBU3021629.1 hypothetical protein [Aestuariibacter sp. A3R04]
MKHISVILIVAVLVGCDSAVVFDESGSDTLWNKVVDPCIASEAKIGTC